MNSAVILYKLSNVFWVVLKHFKIPADHLLQSAHNVASVSSFSCFSLSITFLLRMLH